VRAEAISKRQNFECEYRMLSAAQQVVWVREIVGILSDHEDLQAIGGFMLDVSYRKEAEESLRESQHFIEQIASASPTISYLYDPVRQQSVYVNGRVPDILGYSPQALAEMQPFFVLSLAHPDEIAAHEEHFASLTEAPPDVVVGREFRLRSAAGAWVWLYSRECVFKRDAEGRAIRVVGTLEDITVHRHTVEELEANETLFRRLAETTRVVPFDFNPAASRFTYIGPQAESLLGYPLDQCYHLGSWIEMLHPDDVFEGTRFATEAVSAAPRDFQTEFRLRSASGRLIWFRQIVHCSSEDDERTHVRGFLLDVTESKRIEEERERSKTELRELAARSHKVREEERMNIAREIHDELGQALTLFKLDLAWMSARVHKVVPEPDLQPLAEKISSMEQMIASTLQTVRRVLSALRPPLLDEFGLADAVEWYATDFARRATLRCDLNVEPVDAVPIEAALAVFRIFQEITTNIARHARASRVQVDLRIRGPYVVLVVTDNGRGMSEQDQTKKGHYGLLGMRERAWAFGGQVWVESVPGKGTTVRVEMPFGAAPQALPSSSTEAA
jgi:PAS domain S-box-containing protein